LHYNDFIDLNSIAFGDSQLWSPDDGIVQTLYFSNNLISIDNNKEDVYNDILIHFAGINKRPFEVYVTGNTFKDMWDGDRPLLSIEFQINGTLEISNNLFQNCSANDNIIFIDALYLILMQNTEFKDCISQEKAFLATENAEIVEIHNLTITGTTHGSSVTYEPLIMIETRESGTCIIEGLIFNSNYIKQGLLNIGSSIADLSLFNCEASNEVLRSSIDYFAIESPSILIMNNLTFTDISDDLTLTEQTILISIEAFNVLIDGDLDFQDVIVTNCSTSFFHFHDITGTKENEKFVNFEHLTIQDSKYISFNDIFSFGPLYTEQDIDIQMSDAVFKNINFTNPGNLIYFKQQALHPFVLQNAIFENIIGGHILLEPLVINQDPLTIKLEMYNITANNNDYGDFTFIVAKKEVEITIDTCEMYRNSATFRGSIISIIDGNSFAVISNCKFNNNDGINGGIFYINGDSSIEVKNSTFYNNFAVSSSIAYITHQGRIFISNSTIRFNHAISVGIIEIEDSTTASTIESSSIKENEIIDSSKIGTELDDITLWDTLWFASESYITYLSENRNIYDIVVTYSLISIIEATFNINSGVTISDMTSVSIGFVFNGEITIDECKIENMTFHSTAIILLGSTSTITKTNITNVYAEVGHNPAFMHLDLESTVQINDWIFKDLTVSVISCFNSKIELVNVELSNASTSSYIFDFYQCEDIVFNSFTMTDWEAEDVSGIIKFRETAVKNIENSIFSKSQPIVMIFESSTIQSFTGNSFDGFNMAIQFTKQTNGTIIDTEFKNFVQNIKEGDFFQSSITSDGSALQIIDSNIIVDNCTFTNNTAKNGGAISVYWNYKKPCENTIQNWTFTNNTATVNGGAVNFNSYSPTFSNNIYSNNAAAFGNNNANYATRIMESVNGTLRDIQRIKDVPSGLASNYEFNFVISDVEQDDILTSDSISTLTLSPLSSTSSIQSQSTFHIKSGAVSFTSTIFKASPGKKSVQYILTSSAIDYEMLKQIDEELYDTQILEVDFRWCMPGEIQFGDVWLEWSYGTYSVTWNATECLTCPDYATWLGKEISLNKGYWRMDLNSSEIIECPNEDACLGGYNEANEYPVNWATGYTGILCNEWDTAGKIKYERIDVNSWSKWPDSLSNLIRIIGVGITIVFFLSLLL
jgi:predicted outer membrane repeat protein